MLVAKLKSTGLYLRRHSGSYNSHWTSSAFDIEDRKNNKSDRWHDPCYKRATADEIRAEIFSAKSVNDARIFASESGAKLSLGNCIRLVDLVPVSASVIK